MIRLSAFSDEAGSALQTQIDALIRNAIYLTELRTVDGKNVSRLTEAEAKAISARLRDAGIGLSALGSPMGKVDISVDFDQYLDEVRHMCELACIFGTQRIRMFSFFGAEGKGEQVIDYLCRMVETAAGYGLYLCHENEKKIYGETVGRVKELADGVPGLRFVYDPANFLQAGVPAAESLPVLHAVSDYFHIKDLIPETGELVPAGMGAGEIPRLVSMIGERDTVLTIEPHLKVFDGYGTFDGRNMQHRLHFTSNDEAFDAAVSALKQILRAEGYKEQNGGWSRT